MYAGRIQCRLLVSNCARGANPVEEHATRLQPLEYYTVSCRSPYGRCMEFRVNFRAARPRAVGRAARRAPDGVFSRVSGRVGNGCTRCVQFVVTQNVTLTEPWPVRRRGARAAGGSVVQVTGTTINQDQVPHGPRRARHAPWDLQLHIYGIHLSCTCFLGCGVWRIMRGRGRGGRTKPNAPGARPRVCVYCSGTPTPDQSRACA